MHWCTSLSFVALFFVVTHIYHLSWNWGGASTFRWQKEMKFRIWLNSRYSTLCHPGRCLRWRWLPVLSETPRNQPRLNQLHPLCRAGERAAKKIQLWISQRNKSKDGSEAYLRTGVYHFKDSILHLTRGAVGARYDTAQRQVNVFHAVRRDDRRLDRRLSWAGSLRF